MIWARARYIPASETGDINMEVQTIIHKTDTKVFGFIQNRKRQVSADILWSAINQGSRKIRKMISGLDVYGYPIIEAADGEKALIQFEVHKEQISLLILDIIVPKKNGKIIYESIKAFILAINPLNGL